MEEILTAEQVAQILQIHQFTVLKFIKQGKLKASKLGRVYRIRRSDVEKFLDNQSQKAQASTQQETKPEKKKIVKKVTEMNIESPKEKKTIITGPPIEVPTKEVPTKEEPPVRSDANDIDHYVLELKPQ